MFIPQDPVLEAAFSLPDEERARLADYLLAHLPSSADSEIDPTEVEYRIEALRRGDSDLLSEHLPMARV